MELDIIFNQDCFEGMNSISDHSVDTIISDMPYGTTHNKWDTKINLEALWSHYKRIIKPTGAIVLFAQCPFDKRLALSNLPWLKYEWIWQKSNTTNFLNANYAPLRAHETILVFSPASATNRGNVKMIYNPQKSQSKPYVTERSGVRTGNYARYYPVKTESDGSRYPTDVLFFATERHTPHPTEKPLKLIRYLVRTYSNEGDVILDSFMGSGTTAVAAVLEKRHFIGFETDKMYCDFANDRVNNALKQKAFDL